MNLVINTYPVKLYPLILEEIIDLTVDIDDRLAENYGENLDFTDSISVTTDKDDDTLVAFSTILHRDMFGNSVNLSDSDGKFKAMNVFGYGRTAQALVDGIVPGSVAFKFYNSGYQELGLSGITSATKTGLTAGSTYYLKVSVDGSTAKEISFTADASNTNFGGVNGVSGVNGLNVASSSIQNAGVSGVGLTNLNDPTK